jgi:putative transposon-encoded protein
MINVSIYLSMPRARLIAEIEQVDVVLDGKVKPSGNGGYVGVLKDYIGRKAKILILKQGV